jgi:hypothetical protein
MKRFLILSVLLVFSLPVGFSIAGCAGTNPNNYCNKSGYGYGLKTDQVAAINLPGNTTGISLAYGQTGQLSSPSATNCNGGTQSVSAYTYGSTNLNLIDVNPNTGALCGGTWNRHSPGGIADFTICTAPTPAAVASGCTDNICEVQLTASADGVTSNAVPVWVHPAVTTIQLSVADPVTGAQGFTGCLSQNQTSQLDAVAYTTASSTVPFCAPAGTIVNGQPFQGPDCTANLGHFSYTPVNASVVTIDQNGVATSHLPGSTAITAAIANVSSTAGYFSTCPPASIQVQIPSTISSNPYVGSVTPGTPVPLTTVITDTAGNQITGLTLDYSSTNPLEISVASTGSVTTSYPSTAAITAVCNPPTCNPSVITQIGHLGNGIPVASNSVRITSTGRSSTYLWMASPLSDFFTPVDLTNETTGTPIKLPYIPNSMIMDQAGTNLYFGNYRELMVFSTSSNALSKEDTSVPGVVLAVSPNAGTVVIADQVRQVIYLYTVSNGSHTSIGGLGTRAQYSPDGKTLYVVGPGDANGNNLYINNTYSGWSVFSAPTQTGAGCNLNNNNATSSTAPFTPFCSPDLAVTIPAEGAFVSGPDSTLAYTFCPDTTTAPFVYYPDALPAGTALPATDHITATTDRTHILGANPTTLSDIYLGSAATPGVPVSNGLPDPFSGTCQRPSVNTSQGLLFQTAPLPVQSLSQVLPATPASIDQVVASPDSTIAFVTYTPAAGVASPVVPAYKLATTFGSPGTLSAVQLSGAATAPLAGVFSPDNSIFFVGTAGDNLVHYIDVPSLTDTKTINPGLVDPTGKPVPVEFLAVKPRPTT